MSYCRKGPESDVYVYASGPNRLMYCHDCMLDGRASRRYAQGLDRADMVLHLLAHREAGQKVPYETFVRLVHEMRRRP